MNQRLSQNMVETVEMMLRSGSTAQLISRALGVDVGCVHNIIRGQHYWQQTDEERARRDAWAAPEPHGARLAPSQLGGPQAAATGPKPTDPTPEEIRAHCDRFLAKRKRRRAGIQRWLVPVVSEPDLS